jgi:aryl-alcohol dehydrogenase-like predicted oxidoreductase
VSKEGVMEKVRLGKTGLEVTPICFGTWQLGGDWGDYEEERAARAIRAALDDGINFFDTAQAYGFGRSERVLGKALGPELRGERERVVIATKGGLNPRESGDGVDRDASPEFLREGVEQSLRELGVDQIDLYQVHWPDPDVPFERTAEALAELVAAGKIGHVGVSNFSAAQIEEFSRTLPIEALQPPYHLFDRAVEAQTLPYCADNDIGVLVYGPLAHGLLTGALDESTEFGDDDWRSMSPMFNGEAYRRNLACVHELERIASERGVKVGQLAIAWTLANPAVDVAIVGTRNPDHIIEAIGAAGITLSGDDLAAIEGAMQAAADAPGPHPEMFD